MPLPATSGLPAFTLVLFWVTCYFRASPLSHYFAYDELLGVKPCVKIIPFLVWWCFTSSGSIGIVEYRGHVWQSYVSAYLGLLLWRLLISPKHGVTKDVSLRICCFKVFLPNKYLWWELSSTMGFAMKCTLFWWNPNLCCLIGLFSPITMLALAP